ncbi:MAG: dodecin [Hyphomicrobiales bacterium]
MTDHVYKTIKVTGSSAKSIEDAVTKAITKASETLHGLRWFEVCGIRGSVEDGAPVWQVTVEIGFTLED